MQTVEKSPTWHQMMQKLNEQRDWIYVSNGGPASVQWLFLCILSIQNVNVKLILYDVNIKATELLSIISNYSTLDSSISMLSVLMWRVFLLFRCDSVPVTGGCPGGRGPAVGVFEWNTAEYWQVCGKCWSQCPVNTHNNIFMFWVEEHIQWHVIY